LPGTGTGRLVFDPDGADFVEVAIYDRASLMPGAVILGPAVIVEDETFRSAFVSGYGPAIRSSARRAARIGASQSKCKKRL
jgi:hypothetical protein